MAVLRAAFTAKAVEFHDILKMGRTQLQDAVPMTLGQEFQTYAVMLDEDQKRLNEAILLIKEVNLAAPPSVRALQAIRILQTRSARISTRSQTFNS